jgi:CheY-like chemotaxis protein
VTRCLAADDNPELLQSVCDCLRRFGIQAVAAANAAQMRSAAARGGIDVVILDVRLPDVARGQVARDVQAQAAAARRAIARGLQPDEGLHDGRGNAGAVVDDDDLGLAAANAHVHSARSP